jgi:7-carboxy-7-deazaguanine synthase
MSDDAEIVTITSKQLITISEVFGPTLQGEGVSQGRPAIFVRLALCNLDCKWCDTPYTWDWTGKNGYAYSKPLETRRMTTDDLLERISTHAPLVVITGGEPMLQQRALRVVVRALLDRGQDVEIETNGTIEPHDDWEALPVRFNVSPKLWHSGVEWDTAIKPYVLRKYKTLGAVLKFVVTGPHCIEQIKLIVEQTGFRKRHIWLMPEGRTSTEVLDNLQWIFDQAVKHGWNLSTRLHVLAYNDKRGI